MTPAIDDADPLEPTAPTDADEGGAILSVHLGPSANCSSIGSFVDFLFMSSIAGGAIAAALAALLDARRPETPERDGAAPADEAAREGEADESGAD